MLIYRTYADGVVRQKMHCARQMIPSRTPGTATVDVVSRQSTEALPCKWQANSYAQRFSSILLHA